MGNNGSRLRPLAFGYPSCTYFERKYYLFVGETSCSIWKNWQNRHLVWKQHFWLLCDCASVKEIIEYEGSIPMVCRWDQELFGYHFIIVQWSNKMMTDVDALTSRFGKLISQYCIIASILYITDKQQRPDAYEESVFTKDNIVKITSNIPHHNLKPMLVTTSIVK